MGIPANPVQSYRDELRAILGEAPAAQRPAAPTPTEPTTETPQSYVDELRQILGDADSAPTVPGAASSDGVLPANDTSAPDPGFDLASPTLPEGLDVRDLRAVWDYLDTLDRSDDDGSWETDYAGQLTYIRDGMVALEAAVQTGALDLDTKDPFEQSMLQRLRTFYKERQEWLDWQAQLDEKQRQELLDEQTRARLEEVGLLGRFKNAALNIGAGLTEGLTVAPTRGLSAAAHLVGMDDTSEALRRGADDLQSRIDNKTDPLLDQLPESEFTRVVGSTVPYALAGGGGGALARTTGRGLLPQGGLTRIGATAATATLGAMQNAGERFEAASEFMERGGEDVRDEATVTGALLGTFEAFGTGGGRGVRQALTRRLADQSGPLGRFTTGVLREAGLEGNQETLTQLANDLTSLYMESPGWQFDPETYVKQWAMAAAAGGIVSAPGVAAEVAGADYFTREPDTRTDASTPIPQSADPGGDRAAAAAGNAAPDRADAPLEGLDGAEGAGSRDDGAVPDSSPSAGTLADLAEPTDGLRDGAGERSGAAGELADATPTPEAAPVLTEEVVQATLAEAGLADTDANRQMIARELGVPASSVGVSAETREREAAEAEARASEIQREGVYARAEQREALSDLTDESGRVSMQEAGEVDARLIDVARTTNNLQAALDGYEAARRQEALLLDSTETPEAAIADHIAGFWIDRRYMGDVIGETTNANQTTQRSYFRRRRTNPATGEETKTYAPAEIAEEIAHETGLPITEAQVIDFINAYPNGPGQYRSGVRAARREVMDNLREITGEPVSVARIERLLAERVQGDTGAATDSRPDSQPGMIGNETGNGNEITESDYQGGSLLPDGATEDAPFLLMDDGTGQSVREDVERIVSRVLNREALPETDASGRPTVQTVAGVEAFSALLPERGQALMQAAAQRGLRALAVYVPDTEGGSGRVVIDAEAAQARADREGRSVESVVRAAVLHEMVAHRGLRSLFGENATRELAGIYREIGARRLREATDANGRSVWDKYAHQAERGEDGRLTDEGRALLAEEFLAWLSENLETADPGLLRRIYVRLRRAIRRALDLTLDDTDLEGLLYAAADALRRGEDGTPGGRRFSQGDGLRYSLDGDSFAGVFSKEDEASLPTVTTLEEVRALAEGRPLYVRYSRGPHLDSRMGWRSHDHASGRTEAGLSVVRVPVEATDDVVLSRLTEYEDIKMAGGIRGYLLTGGIAGRDSDGGPVLSGVVPLAWLGDNLSIRGDASYEAINTIRLTATLRKSIDEVHTPRSDYSRDYATRQGSTALLQLRALSEGRRWNGDVERVGTRRRYMEAGYQATGIDPDLGRALTTEEFLRQAEAYLRESPPNDPSLAGIDARFQLDGNAASGAERLAPNGRPSNLNALQYEQVRSPEFIAWFGDWMNDPENASKVVDENGEPLVVYHGTPDLRQFEGERAAFDREESESYSTDPARQAELRESLGTIERGSPEYFRLLDELASLNASRTVMRPAFFTNSRSVARTYTDPFRAFDYQGAEPGFVESFLSIRNPMEIDARGRSWGQRGGPRTQDEQIREARESGRDGLIIRNTLDTYNVDGSERADVYVTLAPEQVKSATGNRGTFDATNPDIRFSVGGDSGGLAPEQRADEQPSTQLSQAEIARVREALNLPNLDRPVARRWEGLLDRVLDERLHEQAGGMVARFTKPAAFGSGEVRNDDASPLSDLEHVAVLVAEAQAMERVAEHERRAVAAAERGDSEAEAMYGGLALDTLRHLDRLLEGADRAGTAAGRALAIRRMAIRRSDADALELAPALSRARNAKGESLTDAERGEIKRLVDEAREANDKVKRLEKRLEAQDRRRAQAAIREALQRRGFEVRPETRPEREARATEPGVSEPQRIEARRAERERLRAERETIKQRIARLMGRQLNAGIDPELAREIGKLALNYAKEARLTLAEVVAKVRADFDWISDVDVIAALAAPKRKERDRTEAEYERAKLERRRAVQAVRAAQRALEPVSVRQKALELLELPRALLSSADLSATLRQGGVLASRRPAAATRIFGKALRAMVSLDAAESMDIRLRESPHFDLAEMAGLYIAPVGGATEVATGDSREEDFASQLLNGIPVVGSVIRASERNYVTFLNLLRMEAFTQFVEAHPEASVDELRAWAGFVNRASGRGDLRSFSAAARPLSAGIFSPRFTVSRFQVLAAAMDWRGRRGDARAEILKDMAAFAGLRVTAMVLGQLALNAYGDDEEDAYIGLDPASADFGKLVIDGELRLDAWAGIQQPIRAMFRTGKVAYDTNVNGEGPRFGSGIKDIWADFIGYKLAPTLSLAIAASEGQNAVGEEMSVGEVAGRSMVPLSWQEAWDASADADGSRRLGFGLAVLGASTLGLGAGVYERPLASPDVNAAMDSADYRPTAGGGKALDEATGGDAAKEEDYRESFERLFAEKVRALPRRVREGDSETLRERMEELATEAREEALAEIETE